MALEAYSIRLDGAALQRGFWLYVIDVRSEQGQHVYVGRTGDSSSANASSPFSRIGQHLDFRSKAKGNALARRLREAGVEPRDCQFCMIAIGPLHPEAHDFASHKLVRDRVAALEKGLAGALRVRGFRVLGKHSARLEPDADVLEAVLGTLCPRLSLARGEGPSGGRSL